MLWIPKRELYCQPEANHNRLQSGKWLSMLKQAAWVFCIIAIVSGGLETTIAAENQAELGGAPTAKRLGPPKVAPVVIDKLRFEVIPWGKERGLDQNGGYIAAFDTASGKELWVLKVYDIPYDKSLESDVQDVFIKTMSKNFFSNKLTITDEKDRKYTVNLDTRTVESE